ncbi:MAG: DUF262 domain-containing protein [Syntrophaceae bacterium]|nr:DUF262 domain-containing protein [Syntrophaceae bacterium]
MIGHPLRVREMLDEIRRKQVKLPEIQRDYVWKSPQVSKFLDSIYWKYPVGQILLWDTDNLPTTKDLKGTTGSGLPSAGNPKIVLDGQQRLTSLQLALGETGEDNKINIWFNLETQQFQRYLRRMKNDPLWVSVKDIVTGRVDEIDILDKVAARGGPQIRSEKGKIYRERLRQLKSIMDYEFPIEIFKSDDYEEVTELFVRINSQGTRLQMAELALAQLAMRLPGVLVDKFQDTLEEYDELGFELEPRFLIRAMIASGTGQSRFKYLTEIWKKKPSELEAIWKKAKLGIDATINFIQHNACFESAEWLPSINALIPLGAFFIQHRDSKEDVENGLLRWFYLASLRGRYSSSPETAMDEDLKAVYGQGPLNKLMKNLDGMRKSFEVTPDEFDDAGWRNPLFPITYALARKRKAADWFTGHELSKSVAGEDHKIQIHHIFPKDLLKKNKHTRKDIDEIANLAFLGSRPNRKISNKSPDIYLAEIADKHPGRLEAQCVPLDRDLWKLDRYQDFLEQRRSLLAKAVNKLLENPAGQAGW